MLAETVDKEFTTVGLHGFKTNAPTGQSICRQAGI
jgi:hypothetical protein